jgi:ankyrin repeat protein
MNVSEDEKDDVLFACRCGDFDAVKEFANKYGDHELDNLRDENGNSILHMAAANGHVGERVRLAREHTDSRLFGSATPECLEYLLSVVSPSLLAVQNLSGSTPLHWAALNAQLPVMKILVEFPRGAGIKLIDIKNGFGKTPLGEAEFAEFKEGADYLARMMQLPAESSFVAKDEED